MCALLFSRRARTVSPRKPTIAPASLSLTSNGSGWRPPPPPPPAPPRADPETTMGADSRRGGRLDGRGGTMEARRCDACARQALSVVTRPLSCSGVPQPITHSKQTSAGGPGEARGGPWTKAVAYDRDGWTAAAAGGREWGGFKFERSAAAAVAMARASPWPSGGPSPWAG